MLGVGDVSDRGFHSLATSVSFISALSEVVTTKDYFGQWEERKCKKQLLTMRRVLLWRKEEK